MYLRELHIYKSYARCQSAHRQSRCLVSLINAACNKVTSFIGSFRNISAWYIIQYGRQSTLKKRKFPFQENPVRSRMMAVYLVMLNLGMRTQATAGFVSWSWHIMTSIRTYGKNYMYVPISYIHFSLYLHDARKNSRLKMKNRNKTGRE